MSDNPKKEVGQEAVEMFKKLFNVMTIEMSLEKNKKLSKEHKVLSMNAALVSLIVAFFIIREETLKEEYTEYQLESTFQYIRERFLLRKTVVKEGKGNL